MLFFVSVGMLFDPQVLVEQLLQAQAVVAIIVFGKSLAALLLVLAFRYPLNTALTVSASLAQIGEFSFTLAGQREAVEQLRARGCHAVAGDASDPAVLIQAHAARARMLVIASPDTFRARRMIEIARTLNPRIRVVMRSHSEEEADLLRREHTVDVLVGEQELANSMVRRVTEGLPAGAQG